MQAWDGQFDTVTLLRLVNDEHSIQKFTNDIQSPLWKMLAEKCLEIEPKERWSCKQVVKYMIDNKKLLLKDLSSSINLFRSISSSNTEKKLHAKSVGYNGYNHS